MLYLKLKEKGKARERGRINATTTGIFWIRVGVGASRRYGHALAKGVPYS